MICTLWDEKCSRYPVSCSAGRFTSGSVTYFPSRSISGVIFFRSNACAIFVIATPFIFSPPHALSFFLPPL